MSDRPVRVRMAPSPTGHLHVGTAKASLFNWMFARRYGGTFILRLEDTDAERSRDEYARELVEGLRWLKVIPDEGPDLGADDSWINRGDHGPYKQSERTALYREKLEQLLAEGKAYWCYCTKEELEAERARQEAAGQHPKYAGTCRDLAVAPAGKEPQIIRYKVPEKVVTFTDLVRGEISTDATLFGDLAIARNIESPLYNFAVVVDDIAMEISHVVRGEDHISNTPKQLVLFEAFGAEPPAYLHFSLNLDADRKKLSKRSMEVSLLAYRDQGFLPVAITNFLALLGWHPAGDRELFTLEELGSEFSIERVQRSGAIFDEAKLRWLNREHMKLMPAAELTAALHPFMTAKVDEAMLERYVEAERGRADTLADLAAAASWLSGYAAPSPDALIPKDGTSDGVRARLVAALEAITGGKDFGAWLAAEGEQYGKRETFHPVRVALSGLERSPDPVTLYAVLGQEEGSRRIAAALESLG